MPASQGPVPAHRRLSVVASPTETDPVCGMTVTRECPRAPASRDGPTISAATAAGRGSRADPARSSAAGASAAAALRRRPAPRRGPATGPARCTRRSCATRPGDCPHLRDGARAARAGGSLGGEPRARRHDTAILGQRARWPRRWWRWRWASVAGALGPLGAGDPRGRRRAAGAGRVFFARALASLTNRRWNMFTLIGLGVAVAYGYSLVVLAFPDLCRRWCATRRGKRRPLLRGGGGDRHAGAARAGAGAARAPADGGGDPRAPRSDAQARAADPARRHATRRSRSTRSPSATGCACGPARRSRSTGASSKGRARSTNR